MGHIPIMSVEGPGDRNPDHISRASAGWHPPHPPTPQPQHKTQADAVSQQLCHVVTPCWTHQTVLDCGVTGVDRGCDSLPHLCTRGWLTGMLWKVTPSAILPVLFPAQPAHLSPGSWKGTWLPLLKKEQNGKWESVAQNKHCPAMAASSLCLLGGVQSLLLHRRCTPGDSGGRSGGKVRALVLQLPPASRA